MLVIGIDCRLGVAPVISVDCPPQDASVGAVSLFPAATAGFCQVEPVQRCRTGKHLHYGIAIICTIDPSVKVYRV